MKKKKITIIIVVLVAFCIGIYPSALKAQGYNCINLGVAIYHGIYYDEGNVNYWFSQGNALLEDNDGSGYDQSAYTVIYRDYLDTDWECDSEGGSNNVTEWYIAEAIFNALNGESADVCVVGYIYLDLEEYIGYADDIPGSAILISVEGYGIGSTLVHEVGHITGLEHDEYDSDKIMYPFLYGSEYVLCDREPYFYMTYESP